MKKTHSLEAQGCTKMLWAILLLSLFLVGNVSAADWDNVKSYDSNTKTVTITNWLGLGDTIGEAKLLTPLNVIVPIGYQKVAEFEIKSYKDYENALRGIAFYNKNDNMKELGRTYNFKYKTIETVNVIDYETVCDKVKFEKNQSEYEKCYKKEKGGHQEQQVVWADTTKDLLKDQTLTIGIFTNVEIGDYVEWIPTLFGVDVEDWATWTASLNVNLVLYYNCNSSDELISHVANLSNNAGAISYNSTNALNGNACQFTIGNNARITNTTTNYTNLADGLRTMNMWFRPQNVADEPMPFSQGPDNNPQLQIYLSKYYLDGVTTVLYDTAPIVNGNWQMLTFVNNKTGIIVYINGTQVQYAGVGASWTNATWNLGSVTTGLGFNYAGQMDELGWWTRALSSTEVTQLYNGGAGMTYISTAAPNPPIVIPYTPSNYANYTTSPTTIDFICYGSDDINFTNMTITINNTVAYTNVSGMNNTNYTYSPSLTDGNYNWSCKGFDNESLSTQSSNRSFTIDGTKPIFTIVYPTNISYTTNVTWINYTLVELNQNKCWYSIDRGVTNISLTCGNNVSDLTSTEGSNTWAIYGNDTLGNEGNAVITFSKDTQAPQISISFPTNVTYMYNITNLNYSYSDTNPNRCWYSIDGGVTNSSSISAGTNFTSVSLEYGLNDLRLYCNDTYGNNNNSIVYFTLSQFEQIGENYDASKLEGSSSKFIFNYTIGNYYGVNSAQLVYNGVYYTGTISTISGMNRSSTYTLTAPSVNADTNKSFNWLITLNDSSTHNSTSHNQLVLNFNLDNCSTNTIMILNLTMKDEDSEAYLVDTIDNTSIKVDLSLSTYTTSPIELVTFSKFYDKTLPARVCINTSLGNGQYYLDSLIEYTSNDRADEFYNIQKYNLNGTSNPYQNITLYDLNTTSNQPFRISYKDTSYLPVESALIEIQRKYADQGVFKIVEIPKTDSYGETVGNLVLNNVIYNFIVKKNGVTLGAFNNVRVVCQTPLISECILNLNSYSSSIPLTNYSSEGDFTYTLSHNRTSRTTSAVFSIPSGTIAAVKLNVTDGLGNNICSQSTTSSSGTLSCTYLLTVKNQTMNVNLYKNNVLVGTGQVDIGNTASQIYGGIMALLGIFIMITLIGVALTDSPVITILFLLVGVILLFGMNLVTHTAFIGYGATILFLIIAIVLILIKAGKRQ